MHENDDAALAKVLNGYMLHQATGVDAPSFAQILAQKKIVMVTGQVSYQLLLRVKQHRTEAATVNAARFGRTYHIPVHRTKMF